MRKLILMMLLPVFAVIPALGDYIAIQDGEAYSIDDGRYEDDHIRLDYEVSNDPGTSIELVSGGIIGIGLSTFNTSTALIKGGEVGYISANGNSKVEITSGVIHGNVYSGTNSSAKVYGGLIGGDICSGHSNGFIDIFGGSIEGAFEAVSGGTIYIHGNDFTVNGQVLNYGDSLKNYGVPGEKPNADFLVGILTGTLQDGTDFDSEFRIHRYSSSDIIVVPEPATLTLLLIGAGYLFRSNA